MNNYKLSKAYNRYYLKKISNHFKKKWGSYLRAFIFCGILAFIGDVVNVWYFKPSKLYTLLDRFFYDYANEHPEVLTKTKAFKWPYISNSSESKLNDVSTFQVEYDSLYVQKEYEFLDRYNFKEMSADERLSAQTFRYVIEHEILEKLLFKNTKFPIEHINGIQVQLPLFMLNCHTISNITDARNYISRLIDVQDKIAELITGNRLNPKEAYASQTTKNILFRRHNETLEEAIHHFHVNDELTIPPQSVLLRVKKQLKIFLEGAVEDNIFYKDFTQKIARLENDEIINHKNELNYEIKKAIEGAVIPSFNALYRTISELELQAPEEITSMQYGLGEMYYQHCLRLTLGMSDTHLSFQYRPKNLYFLGKKELAKETRKLHQLLDSIQIDKGSLRVRVNQYSQSLSKMTHHEYMASFEKYFTPIKTPFSRPFLVKFDHYPKLIQHTFIEPFYYEGSFDNTRKGKVYFSDSVSLYDKIVVQSTAYGLRGLHQWSNTKVLNKDLPLFRRALTFEYIKEFWKNVYINQQIDQNNIDELLSYQIWKVHQLVFLVSDLGVHHYLWTKKEAVEYVYEKSILTKKESENIVDFSTSSIGVLTAKGFGVYLLDKFLEEENRNIDSQFVINKLKLLFYKGAISFSEFEHLMFVNNKVKSD